MYTQTIDLAVRKLKIAKDYERDRSTTNILSGFDIKLFKSVLGFVLVSH